MALEHSPTSQRQGVSADASNHPPQDGAAAARQMPNTVPTKPVKVLRRFRTVQRNKFLADEAVARSHTSGTAENRSQLIELIDKIKARQSDTSDLDDRIVEHPELNEAELEKEIDGIEDHRERVRDCLAYLNRLLAETARDESTDAAAHRSRAASPHEHAATSSLSSAGNGPAAATHLLSTAPLQSVTPQIVVAAPPPTLDVSPETFDGDQLSYRLWRSQFKNWVDRRTTSSGADRLVALLKVLRGAPRELISCLDINDTNYDVALKLLDDNYGQVEIERTKAMSRLVNVPAVRSANDVKGLRQLINHVQGTMMSMNGLGLTLPHYALSFEVAVRAAVPDRLIFDFEDRQLRLDAPSSAQSNNSESAHGIEHPGDKAAERIRSLVAFLQRYTSHKEQSMFIQEQHRGHQQLQQQVPPPTSDQSQQRPSRRYGGPTPQLPARRPPTENKPSTVTPIVNSSRRRGCFFCHDKGHIPSRCSSNLSYKQRCEIIEQQRRCRVCFRSSHPDNQTCPGTASPCTKCNSREHYSAMHPPDNRHGTQSTSASAMVTTAASAAMSPSLVMTASAFVVHGGARLPIRVFLDTGSMISFVSPALIAKLPGVRPQCKTDLQIQGFASEHSITTQKYRLRLASCHDDRKRIEVAAYAYDFGVNPQNECTAGVLEAVKLFGQSHPLADTAYTDGAAPEAPALLIGMDQYYKLVYMRSPELIIDGIGATKTKLGWVVGGQASATPGKIDVARVHTACCAAALSKPARDVERLWSLEAVGVQDTVESPLSVDEADAVRQFGQSVSYDGHSYTVSMPKRPSIAQLANNLDTALQRLKSKRRSLLRDPEAFNRYHAEIMSFVEDGHAEEVSYTDLNQPGSHDGTYFMPHHQVITRVDEKDKWRIVFDCSSSAPGQTSLNAHLLPGPNLNPDLVKLLLNFRLHQVALSVDITRAYMMLNLAEADRPLFRFLWQGPSDVSIRCFQMKKVTWGAAPSGFLLAATLREIFRRVDPASTYHLSDSFYHDDLLCSFATISQARSFVEKIIPWLESANMRLAKWKTNAAAVVSHLEELGVTSVDSCLVQGGLLKVLGLSWSPTEDHFQFQLAALVRDATGLSRITKRIVLRFVASLFDPIGWLLPYSLRGKRMIQQLWSQQLRWDEDVCGPIRESFEAWAAELDDLRGLQIPRQYSAAGKSVKAYHLHVFGDASEVAYASVAYLQCLYEDGTSSCALVMAKSRLAPRDAITLPRLELMAAVISTRLRSFLSERLMVKVDRVFHYTDSTVTYYWCTAENPSRWKAFVCNRVNEIQRQSAPCEWFHVPGPLNIADFATRGVSALDLKGNSEWVAGPDWLSLPEDRRPAKKLRVSSNAVPPQLAVELRTIVAPVVSAAPIVDLDRFSSLESAIRVVSNLIRFVRRCRRVTELDSAEIRRVAEQHLIRWTQNKYFSEEIALVRAGERTPTKSKLAAFALFIDGDGLLRARTRLTKGPHNSYDEANPLVLPGESRLAVLLVLHTHRINAHFGINVVLSTLRRRFWITRARQVIKSLLRRCVICRRSHGTAANQVQAPLPPERVSLVVPFETTGLDFCGPFYTRSREGTVKNYIALFTCSSIRAVHLEVVPQMSTLQTHLAIRRFLASHPGCNQLISDNARSFVKAASDIKRLFNSVQDPEARELLAQRRVRWTFNCPHAPWHGGFFERLVGTVKLALAKTLGRSLISLEELRTIVCELAAIVNDRPLTYVDGDPEEPHAITPAQLLHGGPVGPAICSIRPLDQLGPNGQLPCEPAPSPERLQAALLQRTNYFKSLSVRWYRDYLLQLRTANLDRRGQPKVVEVGDVCLLKDDNLPRVKWQLVRIIDRHVGRDDVIRTYTVKFANGYQTRRPAQLLYPLEVV